METTTDFLIIGTGIAGLSTAIKLQKYGKVLLLSKKDLHSCNTYHAAGGVACSGPWSDDFEGHIKDTLEAGDGLCNKNIVKQIIYMGTERIQELIEWGIHFDLKESGDFDLGMEGGHHTRRVLHTTDLTGKSVLQTLIEKAQSYPNIVFRENQVAINLIKKGNECVGAYILDNRKKIPKDDEYTKHIDKIYPIHAKTTILATGGVGKVYLYTSNPDVASGDGIAMAWRIGAEISNMEFIQFHPTCLYHPLAKNSLITEALRGEGAILMDQKGNRFMENIHPLKDLAPRDIVSRAIDSVLKKTGDDFVYLDISFKDANFIKGRFPGVYNKCKEFGIDMTAEPIPVVPAAHYCCGGIKADLSGQTNIKRLYVVGESSMTGFHGANRLASNSLLEGLVCGHNCGEFVGKKYGGKKLPENTIKEWVSKGVEDYQEAFMITNNWHELRMAMQSYASIVRSESYLMRARRRITLIHEEVERYYWNFKITSDLIELRNLLTNARIIVESALARRESRGAHYLLDMPDKADVVRDSITKTIW